VAWALWAGNLRAAALAALRIPAQAVLGGGLALQEGRLVRVLLAYAAAYVAAAAGSAAGLYGAPAGAAVAGALGPQYGAVSLAVAAAALCLRRAVLARARRLVFADAARYDALWAALTAGPDSVEAIREQAARPPLLPPARPPPRSLGRAPCKRS
jgi:hypothetical protein